MQPKEPVTRILVELDPVLGDNEINGAWKGTKDVHGGICNS